MKWKYFVGATILTAGLLLPYAPPLTIVGGVTLAALLNWRNQRRAGATRR